MNYNKAVRDKIPEIIKKDGHECKVQTLSDDKFLLKLEEKMVEEIQEYQKSKSIEELADILEVIYRIAQLRGTSKEHLEEICVKKADDKGKFEKNLFLIESSD